ncbi:MAG: fumarylacetoacetate hydrolase family protein [Chthoniobacterales bacterium]|nr:fumarylacetoacetate hydrolase family protein [Chthoniobacterales bacterium]
MKFGRIIGDKGRPVWVTEKEGQIFQAEGDPFAGTLRATQPVQGAVRWLPPVPHGAPLLCIGLNYSQHAAESNLPVPAEPVLFLKNPGAATGHLEPIRLPRVCGEEVDYECELAVVIGRECRDVPESSALDYVLGYTAANDVSARLWQLQRGGSQWCRGKSFDTFAPLGPWIVSAEAVGDPQTLGIRTRLNGELVQDSNTADMIFGVARIVSFLSQDTTLAPGTVILTGTPQGIGWASNPRKLLHPGDTVSIEIDRIGTLTNPVVAA